MTVLCETRRWTTTVFRPRVRHPAFRRRQEEGVSLREPQKCALFRLLIEGAILPVLDGRVPLREVFTPPGGWALYDAQVSSNSLIPN
jgi:hypothetical protein